MTDDHAFLAVKDLVTGYSHRPILHSVTFSINKGESVAITGSNGAGKSTLLRALFGLIPAWSGHLALEQLPLIGKNPHQLTILGIAFIPQGAPAFPDLSVTQNLAVAALVVVPRSEVRIRLAEVTTFIPALQLLLGRSAGRLSMGERQLLALGSALMQRPRILLLDEPSLGLSPQAVADLIALLCRLRRERNLTLLLTEHRSAVVASVCDRAYRLHQGRIQPLGPAHLLQDDALLY